ncbi:hypothetical protein E2C01_071254 [Portunus trituberculatus]|uniref:Uncharacterized protein n=1 Tax=Portunus trituberculatus TaxID=210409 RepID=A0A5B7HZH6_PORTR|nr:hypothetical protein [Portunus trituberculatus]
MNKTNNSNNTDGQRALLYFVASRRASYITPPPSHPHAHHPPTHSPSLPLHPQPYSFLVTPNSPHLIPHSLTRSTLHSAAQNTLLRPSPPRQTISSHNTNPANNSITQ